jgi:hypothetical protein
LTVIARDTGVTVPQLIRAMIGSWSWRFALVAAGTYWLVRLWTPHTLVGAAAAALLVTAVYSAIMLPGLMRSPLGNYLRPLLAQLQRPPARSIPIAEAVKEAQ